jgi:hypothetical protein
MRKAYSTIILLLGIGIGGLLFAQKTENSDPENKQVKKPEPEINVHVQKELDEKGNIQRLDSSYSWRWSYQDDIPERLQEFFKNFNQDFSFHFSDSIIFPDGIQGFFDKDFQRIFEDMPWESDSFDEKFQQKFREKLNDMEFRFNWDENFNKDWENRFKEMEERMKELYQRQFRHRGKAI